MSCMVTYHWWRGGRFSESARRLSVLELINSGTMDLRLASLLWLIMEHRASVLVAAGPSLAGKTTTLNVLLDFLHPVVKQIHLRGDDEDFRFLESTVPGETYLVAAEFSDYLGYVWGDVARRAFQLLPQGYALGGTIHAETAKQAIYIFQEHLSLPLSLITNLGLIIVLRVIPGPDYAAEPMRRIESVNVVMPRNDGISIEIMASRESGSDALALASGRTLQTTLAIKFDIGHVSVASEMELREQSLRQLLSDGRLSSIDVRKAVVKFYQSHPPDRLL